MVKNNEIVRNMIKGRIKNGGIKMALKALKYKVEHDDFLSMRMAFNDCIRYSNATIIYIDSDVEAVIEFTLKNPSMRKEALSLYINRWESCGFKLTQM